MIAQGNQGPEYAPGGSLANIGSSSNNFDDGNLNFDKNDTVSKIVKGTSELFMSYDVDSDVLTRVGGFVRGRYWYDFELKDEARAVDYVGQQRELNDQAKGNASGGEFMDAYIFTDWYVGDVPLSVRYGNQVVSWGESTFIQGGINVINPVDVAKLRVAGSELKEAFEGVNMIWASIELTPSLSIEPLYMFEYQQVDPDPAGTYFATNDLATPGGSYAMLGFGTVPQPVI
ncbi:DUF1302 domain-containing protein, partial [Marinobacter sp.]|uniref:DUF1302 domain-containing protein n=1 Tax=Marinobacter sp. TaxID=50741 RepID=UPI0035C693C6